MGYILKLTVILMIVAGIAAGALGLVNMKTRPIIEEYKRMQQEKARAEVMKEGVAFVLCDSAAALPYYKVYSDSENEDLIGYIFTAYGKGYSSTISTVTGIDADYQLVGIKVTFQQETPGLGAKCEEIRYGEDSPWFQRQYFMKQRLHDGNDPIDALTIAVDKDGGVIHSITGATITGRVISNSIKAAANTLKDKVEAGK